MRSRRSRARLDVARAASATMRRLPPSESHGPASASSPYASTGIAAGATPCWTRLRTRSLTSPRAIERPAMLVGNVHDRGTSAMRKCGPSTVGSTRMLRALSAWWQKPASCMRRTVAKSAPRVAGSPPSRRKAPRSTAPETSTVTRTSWNPCRPEYPHVHATGSVQGMPNRIRWASRRNSRSARKRTAMDRAHQNTPRLR